MSETASSLATAFRGLINLADASLGARAIDASDDFFAPKARMLNPELPQFIPGKYDDNGKWMDGWESRRRREPGNDWCIVQLAFPGQLIGVDIDTTHFTGNYPPAASLDGVDCVGDPDERMASKWRPLLSAVPLKGNSHNYFELAELGRLTHVRLNIFPDGGVARLRLFGRSAFDWSGVTTKQEVDLAAVERGGRATHCNDEHFGTMQNLLKPGRGVNMGDGWETRRRREPGNDWCILKLGHAGTVKRVEVDTAHFKGNFPDRCSLQAAYLPHAADASLPPLSLYWEELLPSQKLGADAQHEFVRELRSMGPVTHVRLNIFPDGGVSRLRLLGNVYNPRK